MSATKHTLGPWTLDVFSRGLIDANGRHFATVDISHDGMTPDQSHDADAQEIATARLIAEAPAMLQALEAAKKALADILDNHPDVWPAGGKKDALTPERRAWRSKIEGYRDAARAAIQKATGAT